MDVAPSEYEWALRFIGEASKSVSHIVEVGSRDARDAIRMGALLTAHVNIFEPDPRNAQTCKLNLARADFLSFDFHEIALSDQNAEVEFWSVTGTNYGNVGAGSLFKINFSNRSKHDPERDLTGVQSPVRVDARRFDALSLPAPDLLLMDVQGAELLVLTGFGHLLKQVKHVVLEASFSENYVGACTFPELARFLYSNGFAYVASDGFGTRQPKPSLYRRFRRFKQKEFNALFSNKNL